MTERLYPMQILARLFHEQRAFGQGDPEKPCTTQCEDAAVDALHAFLDHGWVIAPAPRSKKKREWWEG